MTTPNNENDTNNSNIDKVVVKIEQKTESVKKVDTNAILSTGTLPDGTKYHVRLMRLDDVDEVLQVWKSIGLYEGTNTIQSFHAIDPEGFYVAVSEKDGSIIGEVGAIFIEPTTAFIGLYAVRPDCQKMGVGYAVWKQMMKHVGEANVGLYAIDTQYDMYRNKAKLEVEDPVKIVEFQKIGETSPETLANLTQSINNVELVQVGVNDEIINKIISYDQTVARHDRSKLIPLIIGEPDALCLAAIDETSQKLLGYGVIHTSILDKAMVGPIFARSSNIAELLLYHLIDRFPMAKSSGFFIMTCDCNKDFMETVTKLNCTKEHILPRLFRSSYPQIEWSQVYCITSPNYTVV